MADKSVEYWKSLQPTQLISERGPEFVVFNPGSSNLRVGFASSHNPVTVPHCIAWYTPGKLVDENAKGAVGEHLPRQSSRSDREQILFQVQGVLGVRTSDVEESKDEPPRGGYHEIEQATSADIQWTPVQDAGPATIGGFRRFICGEEALRIPASQPYVLRKPMCRGRLNTSDTYSMQQICDDISVIWDWALSTKLSISGKSRRNISAVLVAPDSLDNREVKELITVLLRDLEFHSVVVHQECVAATFGNGVSSACVVQLGAQVTSVFCVEDGVPISVTHRTLPYGGEDISRCLLWIQERHENWPPLETDPFSDSLDLSMLDRLKETHCALTAGQEQLATAEVFSSSRQRQQVYKINLIALNVAPAGLFYPSLLGAEERKVPVKSWYIDHEDMHADSADLTSPDSITNGRNHSPASPTSDVLFGVHEAIVSSILSAGRMELKSKFFSNILLVGGVASTRGLANVLEDKVLYTIPRHESIDKVEVLGNRSDPSALCWKGGAVLGLLDFSREAWIQRSDWKEGGPRVGSSRKYKDSLPLQAQVFWYNAVLE